MCYNFWKISLIRKKFWKISLIRKKFWKILFVLMAWQHSLLITSQAQLSRRSFYPFGVHVLTCMLIMGLPPLVSQYQRATGTKYFRSMLLLFHGKYGLSNLIWIFFFSFCNRLNEEMKGIDSLATQLYPLHSFIYHVYCIH